MIEPKKYVSKTIKRKSGGTYNRKVLSDEWKEWRKEIAYMNKWQNKKNEILNELTANLKEGWVKASFWDSKKEKMIFYKDVMTYTQFIDMRMVYHEKLINEKIKRRNDKKLEKLEKVNE